MSKVWCFPFDFSLVPHPTCTLCRGECAPLIGHDICAYWSAAQWELFVKKHSYIVRKKPSRPSGYVPPAPLASPRAESPSGVSQHGTSASSLSRPSGGLGMHLVFCPGGLPPLLLDLGPARAVGVLLDYRLLRASALSLRWFLRELSKGELLGRSGLHLPATLLCCLSPFLAARSTTWGIVGDFGGPLPRVILSWFPIVDRGRLSRSRSSSRSWSEVEGGNRRGRSLPVCGRVAIGGGLLTATALNVCALILGETGCGLLTATSHIVSVRVPLPAREIGVTARGHTLS